MGVWAACGLAVLGLGGGMAFLLHHPAIQEACVVRCSDPYRGESVKAVVVLREGPDGAFLPSGPLAFLPLADGRASIEGVVSSVRGTSLVLLDETNPRALAFQLRALGEHFAALPPEAGLSVRLDATLPPALARRRLDALQQRHQVGGGLPRQLEVQPRPPPLVQLGAERVARAAHVNGDEGHGRELRGEALGAGHAELIATSVFSPSGKKVSS